MKKALAFILSLLICLSAAPLFADASDRATVRLDLNGGSSSVDKIVSYEGDRVSLSGAEPEKDGMVFRGWAYSREQADKGDLAFEAGDPVFVKDGSRLYASYSYTVTLKPGPEGWGTASKVLYKYPDSDLALSCNKQAIYENYRMAPGKQTFDDQRVFIEWNTSYNSKTSRGIGTAYYDKYTENANVTLYAIWGFKIFYNADGGVFPSTGTGLYKSYVANYDGTNYQNPKTLYGNFGFPDGEHGVPAPVKQGCRLAYISNNGYAFLLLNNSGGTVNMNTSIFTTETASQNLTIPPTGGKMLWSSFHTTTDTNGDPAVEFYAAWEPTITYDANGGSGGRTDQLEIAYGKMYKYENYTIKTAAQAGISRSGYTFKGWNTMPDGSGISIAAGTVVSQLVNSDSYIFYAQWESTAPKNIIISFYANGGTGGPGMITGVEGVSLNIGGSAPTRVGYQFIGWASASNAVQAEYYPNNSYVFYSSKTLYAVWVQHLNHDFQLVSYVPETCGDAGSKTYMCTVCALTTTETVPANGQHTWVASGHPATCGDPGETYFTCSVCGTVAGPLITEPTGEHTYELYSETAATCTQPGSVTYKCTVCGDEYSEPTPALGHDEGTWAVTTEPSCTEAGVETRSCTRCGFTLETREVNALGHNWGDWTVTKPATTEETGIKVRECSRCDAFEQETIPVIEQNGGWSVDGYYLVIDDASSVDVVRLAPGVWTTSDEIRNAPGMLTFNASLIAADTDENGDLRIDLLREGCYSMWIRYTDRTTKIVSGFSVTSDGITPYVSDVTGITVKISDLNSDIKDIFIAKGYRSTYRECNDNKIVRLTESDLADESQTTNYGRTIVYVIDYRNVSPDGNYTVCVRYNSDRVNDMMRFHIDYPTPHVTLHGLQITVEGLQNIKNIRIAPGEYETAGEVKRADGVRIFSKNDKTLRNVADSGYEYTIQCRDDGPYTLSIEYIGGYSVVTTVDVRHIAPSVTENGDGTLTFGCLDFMYVIRYAPGVITQQKAFKTAAGNRYFKPKDVTPAGTLTTPALTGVWSFMIQYDELSYTIFSYDFDAGQYVGQ